jgi:hypothetical protein
LPDLLCLLRQVRGTHVVPHLLRMEGYSNSPAINDIVIVMSDMHPPLHATSESNFFCS